MGRDNTGKQQEQANLATQNQIQQDTLNLEKGQFNKANAQTDALKKTPGYTPSDLTAMRGEQAQEIGSLYGSEADTLKRNAAQTGNANDAGLYPQMSAITNQRSRDVAMGNNQIAGQQASQVLQTRRMLPGLYMSPGQTYAGNSTAAGGAATSLVNGRIQADQTTPLWAQMGMQAMSSAGQAATGKL